MVYSKTEGPETTGNESTPPDDQARCCIKDAAVLALADAAVAIEDDFSGRAGQPTPMDIEWARDGLDGEIYIVQARPETVASRRPRQRFDTYRLREPARPLLAGRAVGSSIASRKARVITDM
ncbi:PEP/pyruvate-binding domain-containing protein [Variovorax humicola]|uniref:Phosphoenolpyruvate synthase n=1 Tax=Variovorax humicola TaxID=1769758 RepID=A0ABU8WBG5_9BURK